MRLWHFTSTTHLPMILADGKLKPTDSMLDPYESVAPPCVWLLDTPVLDYPHGIDIPGWAVDKTEVRFEIEVPDRRVVRWLGWAEMNGVTPWWLESVIEAGGGRDAAQHWCSVFRNIPRSEWVNVEIRQADNTWKETA